MIGLGGEADSLAPSNFELLHAMRHFPPKIVSMLCLLQSAAIVMGYVLTRSMHKVYVQRLGTEVEQWLPQPAWFTRTMLAAGPWFLILPLVWGVAAMLGANLDGGIPEASRRQTRVGYLLTAGLAAFAILSAFQMFGTAFSVGKLSSIPGGID